MIALFLGGASGKEPTCQCRRLKRHRFNSWVGKIPWTATHYSILACRIRGAWQVAVHGVTDSQTRLSNYTGIKYHPNNWSIKNCFPGILFLQGWNCMVRNSLTLFLLFKTEVSNLGVSLGNIIQENGPLSLLSRAKGPGRCQINIYEWIKCLPMEASQP